MAGVEAARTNVAIHVNKCVNLTTIMTTIE
jgi:hypothetical protein